MSEEKEAKKRKICPLLRVATLTSYKNILLEMPTEQRMVLEGCIENACAWFKNGECAITHIAYLPKW